ncbi:hypothetical protein [Microbacterium cremeum]|uniref:hypothetical protein n=1 Tax=Microbacterium cremeum TaxID=2782169 RepID=UPI001888BDA6|nr:hypothetical protein [Microbacterium cremeum]
MNVKFFVVVLVALVVAAVLVIFYGAVRPPATPDDARGGVEGPLGWLDRSRTLTFADVADAPCAIEELETLFVPAQTACDIELPEPARLVLCTDAPDAMIVRTKGSQYPAQDVDSADLSCTEPEPIPVYDDGTVLTLTCVAVADECVVRVLSPEDANSARGRTRVAA